MRKLTLSAAFLFSSLCGFSQFSIGAFGGLSNYQGDLISKYYQQSKAAVGLTVNYDLSERFTLRAGFTYGQVSGDDRKNKTKEYLQLRNLNFQSSISEFSLLAEYNVFNLSNIRWTPYVMAGLAAFHFDPYTYDSSNRKVFLKPLSTEGQGLPNYPDVKPYSLTQLAVPLGGGVKYALSDKVLLALEVGVRKLFTDYLDDVSANYADAADLFAERGPVAVELAYRGDEVPGGNPVYPDKGAQRGSSDQKDWYYFTGLHIKFQLGGGSGSANGSKRSGRNQYGCPVIRQ